METLLDLNKICRVCLKSESLVSIFSDAFTVRPVEMVQKIDLFKIDALHGLATYLCETCTCRLIDAYNLKEQCEYSNARLQEYLHLSSPISLGITKDVLNEKEIENPQICENVQRTVKDEEIYDAMNIACEIFSEARPPIRDTSDDTLHDIIIDVNSLTQSENQDEIDEDNNHCENEKLTTNYTDSGVNRCDLGNKTEDKTERRNNPKLTEKCPECGKTFTYRVYLEIHMRTHSGEKPFECEICKRCFSQMSNLTQHMRIHTGEKRYQCEICSKFFTASSNLIAHKIKHTDSRNFFCTECPRTFKTDKDLASHIGTHTGVKSFICKICQKAFYKVAYLNVHVRNVHRGEKRYKCTECDKAFSNSSNLICHFRIHTGENPYKCDMCNSSFKQSSALVRHSKKHAKLKSTEASLPYSDNKQLSKDQMEKVDYDKILDNNLLVDYMPPLVANTVDLHKAAEVSEYAIDFSKDTTLEFSRNQHSFDFHPS